MEDKTPSLTTTVDVLTVAGETVSQRKETVAVETTIEIWLNDHCVVARSGSPSHLQELAVGVLLGEGYLQSVADIQAILYQKTPQGYRLDVTATEPEEAYARGVLADQDALPFTLSDCNRRLLPFGLDCQKVPEMMERFVKKSTVFQQTGGVHCGGVAVGDELLFFAEDIARYQAFHKSLGYAAQIKQEAFSAAPYLLISGRVSAQMILACARVGVKLLISKSAPLSQAVQLAQQYQVGLLGFVRGTRFHVYHLPEF